MSRQSRERTSRAALYRARPFPRREYYTEPRRATTSKVGVHLSAPNGSHQTDFRILSMEMNTSACTRTQRTNRTKRTVGNADEISRGGDHDRCMPMTLYGFCRTHVVNNGNFIYYTRHYCHHVLLLIITINYNSL